MWGCTLSCSNRLSVVTFMQSCCSSRPNLMNSWWRRLWQLETTPERVTEATVWSDCMAGREPTSIDPASSVSTFPLIISPNPYSLPRQGSAAQAPMGGAPIQIASLFKVISEGGSPTEVSYTPKPGGSGSLSAGGNGFPLRARSSERAGKLWREAAEWHHVSFSWPSGSSASGFFPPLYLIEVSL